MYRRHDIRIRRKDVERAFYILIQLEKAGDVDTWKFIGWDESTVLCSIAPVISEDMDMIKNKLKEAGIQIM